MPRHVALAYIDLLTCLLAVFFCFFIILDDSKTKGNDTNVSRFLAEVTWSKDSRSDVDLWMKAPDGSLTFYKQKQNGSVSLDVDDRGMFSVDVVRREVISVKSLVPGHYVVNVMLYSNAEVKSDLKVRATVTCLIPFSVIAEKDFELNNTGQEMTVASFDVMPDGSVQNIDKDTQVILGKVVE
jgi:uncharacterized protein YfaP (DUF2135 family)